MQNDELKTTSSGSSFCVLPSALGVVTLLTDFGTSDYFVGAMKGAVLRVNPQARIVDITHEIPPHDITAGAFTLMAAYGSFPAKTVHVAVVDPGVGSERRPILVTSRDYFFVGPDNGLFGYVYELEEQVRVFHLTNERYFSREVSATFHGRDLFAPVAGAVSAGVEPSELGSEITDYVRLEPLAVRVVGAGQTEAAVIHVDRFGNCITNITRADLTGELLTKGARLVVAGREITSFRKFFAEGGTLEGELFAVWGSAGFLEIAAFKASAARLLDIKRGERVLLLVN
ncbi:MAG TPA: SAM-dependent chlorinase/fluorinase [Pyrinomonadaceae bacterium]|nr:SAM-dependent chlorinase/fluorinase [Pyrinomonadaceae bacterium]